MKIHHKCPDEQHEEKEITAKRKKSSCVARLDKNQVLATLRKELKINLKYKKNLLNL
jgi:hypothetical protein